MLEKDAAGAASVNAGWARGAGWGLWPRESHTSEAWRG